MNQDWCEIWIDDSPEFPYILLLCPSKEKENQYLIIDPKEDYKVIRNDSSYDEATLWLLEDEYTLVNGRMDLS